MFRTMWARGQTSRWVPGPGGYASVGLNGYIYLGIPVKGTTGSTVTISSVTTKILGEPRALSIKVMPYWRGGVSPQITTGCEGFCWIALTWKIN